MNIFQLEERLGENPDSPLSARLAGQYLIRGKITDAVSLSLRCIEQNPDYATAYIILGRCYAAIKCYREAILCGKKAFSIQPDSTILKNLIVNWEKSFLKENLQSSSEFPSEIPDFNKLQEVLFKEPFLTIPSEVEAEKIQASQEDKMEKIQEAYQEINTTSESGTDNAKQTQQVEEHTGLVDEIKPEQEVVVVEFVEQNQISIPPAIEAVLQSIDIESSPDDGNNYQNSVGTIESSGEVNLTELEETLNENLVEQSDVNLSASDLKTETGIFEQTAEEINFKEQDVERHEAEEVSEIETQKSVEKIESELSENKTTLSEPVEAEIIGEELKDFNAIVKTSEESEGKAEPGESESISMGQETVSDSNLKEDNTKKSDEHIAKIFESAHETTKKETGLDNVDFNHGPVPELPQIVSVTLAEIYTRQGEYEEAIKTYRALIRLRPKQKELFEKKIEELERKLKSQL